MAFLFTVENKSVRPHDETLRIPPYKEIWERDKSKNKEYALEDFTYIEFMESLLKTNPYRGYSEEDRKYVLKTDIITRNDWVEDELIAQGRKKLKSFQKEASPTYTLYLSALTAKDQLEDFFKNLDMSEKNARTGVPIYKPKDITSALLDMDKVIASLSALKKKVEEELFEEVKIKGQKELSIFADPNSL